MTPRRVVLLRHGRTAWNAQRRFQGQADPPLDDTGHAQAAEVAPLLAALRPELLVSSDAARALQTAAPVGAAAGLPVTPDSRFRERHLGDWEGLTREEVADRFPDQYRDWLAGRDISRRGGETREQVAERALAGFAALPEVGTAVIVTHTATAMALTNALLGIAQRVHPLGPLANCHWSELSGEAHDGAAPTWRLRGHNLGAYGAVVPLLPPADDEDPPDADA